MSSRAALLTAVGIAMTSIAVPARALSLCEEDAVEVAERVAEARAAVDALPIVPCAMVESGVLGPACADATFYVVTDAGVTLCSVDLDTFQLTQAPARAVETAPAAPLVGHTWGGAPAGLLSTSCALPACLCRDLDARPRERVRGPLDRGERPPVPPS